MDTLSMKVEQTNIDELIPYASNSRTHSEEQVAQIAASIKEFGFNNPVLLDGDNGIIAGHGRTLAARKLGLKEVPTIELAHLSNSQRKAYIIADNKLALNAGWDMELLSLEMGDLKDDGFDLSLLGFDDTELAVMFDEEEVDKYGEGGGNGLLAEKFGVPPFSVLNAREGWWQNRKSEWLALGIESEEGRGDNLLKFSDAAKIPKRITKGTSSSDEINRAAKGANGEQTGTSIFDPTLCELAYKWFSPPGGLVLDPFAGGSVRGIVAAQLGRQYIGYELRDVQVEANRVQADVICEDVAPAWVCDDSMNIDKADITADFLFTCPPYADLEVYSEDPKDLSTMGYADFKDAYFEIIKRSCAKLKDDRFACVVIGEVRGKDGNYYNFVGDTIQAFLEAGMDYYNEMILVTAIGSLPIRVGRQFNAGRKIGKTHQNVLVFVKGSAKKATQAIGDVEFGEAKEDTADEGL